MTGEEYEKELARTQERFYGETRRDQNEHGDDYDDVHML